VSGPTRKSRRGPPTDKRRRRATTAVGETVAAALPEPAWFAAVRQRAGRWFRRHARDLPWRQTRDPLAVWLSEVMLQQTQVATVQPYYARFLARFPTIAALAAADEQDVLRLWEGLGYYRRARQLHQAARRIVAEHGGRFPREFDDVVRLPGIGRYTAGAVLSIAFDQPQPILEANTARLWCRLLGYGGDPASAAGQRLLWAAAAAVLPRRGSGQVNQALMELGSLVCSPRQPRCDVCPLAALCGARQAGLEATIPRAAPRPAVTAVREAAVVVRRRGRVLLLRRPEGGRWAGLWDFPRFALSADGPAALRRELAENVRRLTGVEIIPGERLTTLSHSVTRFRIRLECYAAECAATGDGARPPTELRWVRPAELADYPLNTTARKLARQL
jgi:A/G-specific adenine glycosylase